MSQEACPSRRKAGLLQDPGLHPSWPGAGWRGGCHWAQANLTTPCPFLGLGTATQSLMDPFGHPQGPRSPTPTPDTHKSPLALGQRARSRSQPGEPPCLRHLHPLGCISQASLARAGQVCRETGSRGLRSPEGWDHPAPAIEATKGRTQCPSPSLPAVEGGEREGHNATAASYVVKTQKQAHTSGSRAQCSRAKVPTPRALGSCGCCCPGPSQEGGSCSSAHRDPTSSKVKHTPRVHNKTPHGHQAQSYRLCPRCWDL